jgi:predicted nuclease of predicted toxin-antitoxin system
MQRGELRRSRFPCRLQEGFEAVHWSDVGRASASDTEIMDYADARGFVIVMHDLDFGMLLQCAERRDRA